MALTWLQWVVICYSESHRISFPSGVTMPICISFLRASAHESCSPMERSTIHFSQFTLSSLLVCEWACSACMCFVSSFPGTYFKCLVTKCKPTLFLNHSYCHREELSHLAAYGDRKTPKPSLSSRNFTPFLGWAVLGVTLEPSGTDLLVLVHDAARCKWKHEI